MMRYKYQVHRKKRTQEEIDFLIELYKDEVDELGEPIIKENDVDLLFKAPSVEMKCAMCDYEESVEHSVLIELNYGNKGLHSLACPKCNHTKKRGVLYPKNLIDLDGNPITYQDVLNSK